MKITLILRGTTCALFLFGSLLCAAPAPVSSISNSTTPGPLGKIQQQVTASAAAFQQGSDATGIQALATATLPVGTDAAAAATGQGWRLSLVAHRLAFLKDYATARHVADLALTQLQVSAIAKGTAAEQAQAKELCGGLYEFILNDKVNALAAYQQAVALDPHRGASTARAKVLSNVQAAAASAQGTSK